MSWSAYLIDDRGHYEGEWNYTHNTNGMANMAAVAQGWLLSDDCWWTTLDGKSGPQGVSLINDIITAMEANPSDYRALNPPNGWGDYEGFLAVLKSMMASVPEWPTKWSVSG